MQSCQWCSTAQCCSQRRGGFVVTRREKGRTHPELTRSGRFRCRSGADGRLKRVIEQVGPWPGRVRRGSAEETRETSMAHSLGFFPIMCRRTCRCVCWTLWVLIPFFLCSPYVTGYSRHKTKNHQTDCFFLFFWIVSYEKVRRMMITRIISMKSFSVTKNTNDMSWVHADWLALSQQGIRTKCYMIENGPLERQFLNTVPHDWS